MTEKPLSQRVREELEALDKLSPEELKKFKESVRKSAEETEREMFEFEQAQAKALRRARNTFIGFSPAL